MTAFTDDLPALQIAVDCLHATARASFEAGPAVEEALDLIRHLGFDTRPSAEGNTRKTFVERGKQPVQRGLFPDR